MCPPPALEPCQGRALVSEECGSRSPRADLREDFRVSPVTPVAKSSTAASDVLRTALAGLRTTAVGDFRPTARRFL